MSDDTVTKMTTPASNPVGNATSRAAQKKAEQQARLAAAQSQMDQYMQSQANWATQNQGRPDPNNPAQYQQANNPYDGFQTVPYGQQLPGTGGPAASPYASQIAAQQKLISDLNMQASGLNPDGSPIAPEFQTILNDDGTLPDQYKLNLQQLDPNTLEGYNLLKGLATQQGPSKYAQAANQQTVLGRQDAIDSASRSNMGAQAEARSALAARGGASTGSRERLAMNGNDNVMAAKQGAYRAQGGQLLDVMKQDETMKRDALSKFGEAEGKIALSNNSTANSATQYNLNNVLKEQDMGRSYTMDNYKSALDKWAATKQAEATRNSGGGGGK